MFKYNVFFLLPCIAIVIASQVSAAENDPTRPFGHSASSTEAVDGKELVLESIIRGDGIQTVIISGNVLKMLDYIGEYQLTAVNDQSVILRSKEQRLKLTIFKGDIVKTRIAK